MEANDIYAGPILRRVSKDSVSVWCALRVAANVTLQIWRGPAGPGDGAIIAESTTAPIQVGEELFVVLATVTLSATTALEPGRMYGYDLRFGDQSLGALGLLRNDIIAGHRHLALGYVEGNLPTFVVPPREAKDLVFSHGSCRRPASAGKDGLVALDQIIERNRLSTAGVSARPHFMFHTGDQIYADDVGGTLLGWITAASTKLIGRNSAGEAIERVRVNLPSGDPAAGTVASFPVDELHFPPCRRQRIMTRAAGFSSDDSESHAIGFGEFVGHYLFSWCNQLWPRLDDEIGSGPGVTDDWQSLHARRATAVREYLERWLLQYNAGLAQATGLTAQIAADTIGNADDRLDLIEGWRLLPNAARAIDQLAIAADFETDWAAGADTKWQTFWGSATNPIPQIPTTTTLRSSLVGSDADLRALQQLLTPAWYAGMKHAGVYVGGAYSTQNSRPYANGNPSTIVPPANADEIVIESDQVLRQLRELRRFYRGLPYARRAMANVSNLMMFDDHEITDDWNISRKWVNDVNRRALGRDTVSNGLAAYALCQDWGNAPERYAATSSMPNQQILQAVQTMFRQRPGGAARPSGPDSSDGGARKTLERIFGLDGGNNYAAQAEWHWRWPVSHPPTASPSVESAAYEIMSLDNRTRRGFETNKAAPANITIEGMQEQITAQSPASSTLTLVVSPLPPIGYPVFEQLGQPFLNVTDDLKKNAERSRVSKTLQFSNVERDYKFGRLVRDPEPWGFQVPALEALFARLATRRIVIFLSGDVHYSLSIKMTYWKNVPAAGLVPAHLAASTRFVQLTSSALQKQSGADEIRLLNLPFIEQLAAVITGPTERLGWQAPPIGHALLTSSHNLSPQVRVAMRKTPVLLTTASLPADVVHALRHRTPPMPPDWAYRFEQVKDRRPDAERYGATAGADGARPLVTAEALAEGADRLAAIRQIANHHNWHARFGNPRRFTLRANIAVVNFQLAGTGLELIHKIYSADASGFAASGGGVLAADNARWPEDFLPAQPYMIHRIGLNPDDELPPDQLPPA